MREPIVDSEDSELEYNPYGSGYLQYKGKLFTGTLIDTDTNPISFHEYTDGDLDGYGRSYHKNGMLQEDAVYKNGTYIFGKEWYDNGQLRYDSNNNNIIWDADGLLTRKDLIYFYKNGNPRTKKDELGTYFLSPNGDIAISISPFLGEKSPCSNKITFFDKVITSSLSALFDNIYSFWEDNRDSRIGLDRQISHYIICLYRRGYKSKSIDVTEQVIEDAVKRKNNSIRITSDEDVIIHNYSSLKKHLEDDRIIEVFPYHTDECVTIIFE
jgi:hypothetical protein